MSSRLRDSACHFRQVVIGADDQISLLKDPVELVRRLEEVVQAMVRTAFENEQRIVVNEHKWNREKAYQSFKKDRSHGNAFAV